MRKLRALISAYLCVGLGSAAGAVGIASGLDNLFGGSSGGGGGSSGGAPGQYVPTDRPGTDTNWQQLMQQIQPYLQQNAGALNTGIMAGYGSTQPGGMFAGSQTAALDTANTSDYLAASNMNQIPYLQSQGQQIMNNAMDPQQALYNQYAQQVQDQANANTSMRGIGMGAEAAGIANQAGSNFMNQWQNQQLARQVQGAGALNQLYGQAGNYGTAAGQDLTGYLNFLNQGATMPANYGQDYGAALTGGVYGPSQSQGNQYGQYLGLGNQAGQNAFNNQQTGLGNLASGLGGLANIYNYPSAPNSQQSYGTNQNIYTTQDTPYG